MFSFILLMPKLKLDLFIPFYQLNIDSNSLCSAKTSKSFHSAQWLSMCTCSIISSSKYFTIEIIGGGGGGSPEILRCVLEQDTLSST